MHTREAWRCFYSMFADEVLRNRTGAIGYGYDRCFNALCGTRLKCGVLLGHLARHAESAQPPGRRLAALDNPLDAAPAFESHPGRRLAGVSPRRRLSLRSVHHEAEQQAARLELWVRNRSAGRRCEPRKTWHECDPTDHGKGPPKWKCSMERTPLPAAYRVVGGKSLRLESR